MKSNRSMGLVPGLAWADLKHEWILSLCLFLAVAAVIGPLLLLFGLKNGTMETLRSRLLQDPRNREIHPMVSRSFTPEWLQNLQKDSRVEFLVPTTRTISASVELKSINTKLTLEAQPSAQGDPLLTGNNAAAPGDGQCVLSAEAARKLKVSRGDSLVLLVKRLKGSRFESGRTNLTLSGVLDPRGTGRDVVYLPLKLLEDIEGFKDGQAVPDLGWAGSIPFARPVFDGVVLGLDHPMDPVLKVRLTSGTGLSRVKALPEDQQQARLGYKLTSRKYIYLVTTKRSVGKEVLTTIQHRLRGKNALVLPWVSPLEVQLGKGEPLFLFALPGIKELNAPWSDIGSNIRSDNRSGIGPDNGSVNRPAVPDLHRVILPQGLSVQPGTLLTFKEKSLLSFTVKQIDTMFSDGKYALAHPELAGILNLSRRRDVSWQPEINRFILKRRGYAAFRLYARTLDDVEPLKLALESQDIPVHTEAERIRDLKELDKHLGMIFWLISLGGLLGGAGSLAASLYASVERKRRDLGVLGLIGLGRGGLLCFPLYQALFLSLGGLGLAFGFYTGMSGLINHLFSSQLAAGESFCRLNFIHLASAACGVVFLGQTAAAIAAWRVITIDPAEALRDE